MRLIVSGERACFRRPEFKRDLVSYDVITPPAARMILDRLHRSSGLQWSLDRIDIFNPIERGWEAPVIKNGMEHRLLALRNVRYGLEARLTDPSGADQSNQHRETIALRAMSVSEQGSIFLGLKDFPARVELEDMARPMVATPGPDLIDFGWVPYETGRGPGAPARFFHATAERGSIDLRRLGDNLAQ